MCLMWTIYLYTETMSNKKEFVFCQNERARNAFCNSKSCFSNKITRSVLGEADTCY